MPFDRAAYPADWPAISLRIRERAGWRCEACGVPGGEDVTRIRGRSAFWLADTASGWFDGQGRPVAWEDVPSGERYDVRIVLTVAHLPNADGPMDCRDEVLMALCQACHLRLDGALHARNAAITRRRKREAAGQLAFAEGGMAHAAP